MDDLTLILCDPSATAKTGAFHHLPKSIHAVSAADLNKHTEDLSTELFALTGNLLALTTAELAQSRKLFQSQPHLQMLLYFSRSQKEVIASWQDLPFRVAALCHDWAREIQAVIVRSSIVKGRGFADTPSPVWDMIIRVSTLPGSIQIRPVPIEIGPEENPQTAARPRLAPQVPGDSRRWLRSHLQSITSEELVPKVTSQPDAVAVKAGLFQIHDYLHESHDLSQGIEGEGRNRAGDYWHAIMHRREPDYGNSKYWFRHVGQHPIFEPLAKAVDAMLQKHDHPAQQNARQKLLSKGHWDPFAFVDFCQECARRNDPEWTQIAEEIQWREMTLLLAQTCRDVTA